MSIVQIACILLLVMFIIFLVQYVRHVYWYLKVWGEPDNLNPRIELIATCIFGLHQHIIDYGIVRIVSGSSIPAHKRMLKEREVGFDLIKAVTIQSEVISEKLSDVFPSLLRVCDDHTYYTLRVSYLRHTLETNPALVTRHLEDMAVEGVTVEHMVDFIKSPIPLHGLNPQHYAKLCEDFDRFNKFTSEEAYSRTSSEYGKLDSGAAEVYKAYTDIDGVRSMICATLLSNGKCKKLFGIDITDLPFSRD